MATTVSVTCRNLTDVFVLMRNNSLRNKHIISEQVMDDSAALVSSKDLESGSNSLFKDVDMPPFWVDGIEDVQYEMSRIRQKLQELTLLHEKLLTRPSIDDAVEEEKDMAIITQDITKMFFHCKKIIYQIRDRSCGSCDQNNKISRNVLTSLVSSLQELSSSFHYAQSNHLKKLQCREKKSQHYFDTPYYGDHSSFNSFQDDYFNQPFLKLPNEQKQVMIDNNVIMIENQEKEVKQIIQSLVELNDIFQDLAVMIADQGTVLDRIDYNLEKVQTEVHCGLQQLQKTKKYHQKNRKMLCIILLAVTTIILTVILVIFKV